MVNNFKPNVMSGKACFVPVYKVGGNIINQNFPVYKVGNLIAD